MGGALARFTFDDVRDAGTHRILPLSPVMERWVEEHPEYHSVLYGTPEGAGQD